MLATAIPYRSGETPDSYCSRLAIRCGRASALDFCRDFALTFRSVITGAPAALSMVGQLGGVDTDTLIGAAFIEQDGFYACSGQLLTVDSFDRKRLKACPACIRDDLAQQPDLGLAASHRRISWMLTSVRTCPVHDLELVDLLPRDEFAQLNYQDRHDYARLLERALRQSEELEHHRPASSFERYLIARFDGGQSGDVPWLDGMPFYAAVRTCEYLGAAQIYGVNFKASRLTDDERYQAGAAGFEIAASGPEGVREFFKRGVATEGAGPRLRTVESMFGKLYYRLRHENKDSAFDPVREIIREVALDSIAFGPGDEIFGQPAGRRTNHSVYSLSAQTGIYRHRLRRLLYDAGLIRDEDMDKKDDQTLVATDGRLDDFLARIGHTVSFREAVEYLNAPKRQTMYLFEAGFIQAFARPKGSQGTYAFMQDSLDDFLARLLEGAEYEYPQDDALCDILGAARHCGCRSVDVVQLILDRKLETVRRDPGLRGFASVLVNKHEVRSKILSIPKAA
jgi:hypothetical protein